MKLELPQRNFEEKLNISNLVKIRRVGAELLRADRQTNVKLTVAFRKIANAPKNARKA